MRCRSLLAIVAALLAVVPFAALASGPDDVRLSLGWVRLEGAEQCISAQELAREVEKRLGRTVFVSPAVADGSIEGFVQPRAKGGFQATLVLHDENGAVRGRRELQSDASSCAALSDEIALVLAVMIDPDASLFPPASSEPSSSSVATSSSAAASTSASAHPAASASVPAMSSSVASTPPVALPTPWRASVDAALVGAVDLLPSFTVGAAVRFSSTPPHFWRTELIAEAWLPRGVDIAPDASTDFSLVEGGALLCPLEGGASVLEYSTCAGAKVGALRAESRGLRNAGSQERLRVDLALEMQLAYAVARPLFVVASLGVVVPLLRDTFDYTDSDGSHTFYRPSPVAFLGGLGLRVEL